jgi:hypothetical protein
LDLLGVALVGVVASLAIEGIGPYAPNVLIGEFLKLIGVSNFSFQIQTAFLGGFPVFVMVSRPLLSVLFVR